MEATQPDDPWVAEPCQAVARPNAPTGAPVDGSVATPAPVVVTTAAARPVFVVDVAGAGLLAR
eukprot:3015868-Lingulodinium_polyedra.AAC.1